MGTNEYYSGNRELAVQLGCSVKKYRTKGIKYILPPENGDSWLIDVHPAPGLFVTDAYFSLHQPVTRIYEIEQPGLWLFSLSTGDVTIMEQGKKSRRLQRGIHLLVNQGKPCKVIFGSSETICYTSTWIFADFLADYLKERGRGEELRVEDALTWLSHFYNTPEVLMAFEQLKYTIRISIAPFMYYESKIIEILSLILCGVQNQGYSEMFIAPKRPKHLTYQNIKLLWRVKEELDKDILSPPNVEQLARIAGMGTTKLRQAFKVYYKLTIADYVRQEKMNYALRLLSNDEMSVQNISTFLGYASPSKFTVAFKRVHGFTPRDARKTFNI
ncbi:MULTISPECIES: helix-turn-helix transcriptional regulator [Pelosinus]|uniref:Helix-turn-helix, AraC domain-containing protein n=1 Tax=Pelosinus fermentans B4 TaxID=1149862 RepID=I9LIU8_9FIRM|nr:MULTISPECIES: AraC family transcriptional regulator [Pelosinus]EIW20316.1 Helix-turn-helix, AraC domain-containing protein [Pelosinus fermentans B4]EIW25625.1 transcriptional regulator, AraC family [Pelosinus fermentans A11]OAM93347.1 transcriptional regulator with only HTH domain, AraC family [Pelosinus fermentans DSM 17108]SDQ74688.1 AraC-type DNA-binding protein [Pelosinus fermentans]